MTEEQKQQAINDATAALEAAAWYGIALNTLFPPRDRLQAALAALEYYAPDDPEPAAEDATEPVDMPTEDAVFEAIYDATPASTAAEAARNAARAVVKLFPRKGEK